MLSIRLNCVRFKLEVIAFIVNPTWTKERKEVTQGSNRLQNEYWQLDSSLWKKERRVVKPSRFCSSDAGLTACAGPAPPPLDLCHPMDGLWTSSTDSDQTDP
jgi:hypothetical protein